jgi:translation initiation factor 5B
VSLQNQNKVGQNAYNEKYRIVYADLIKMDINSKNYWEKNEDDDFINIIPTSAITGEGMPDLLGYICHMA